MTEPVALKIWDDNPSLVDLLGFDAVVGPIVEAIGTADVDPLAIGVHSPWGGGKSTVLNLLEERLKAAGRYVVIRSDPWQYDNHEDVRGSLIAEVLDQLGSIFDEDGTIKDRITDLVKRISWTRVGLAIGKGALTMQWKPEELVDAFTPRGRSDDKSMAGFKRAFETLVDGLPNTDRVVVLVDDLDRCLPPAVMATLEGIKLFLAVPKMAFVIAADQEMVRDSIAASLGESNRSGAFATRYLDKIVQLPVTLPRLTTADAEAYIGLLLARTEGATEAQIDELTALYSTRRHQGLTPLLGELGGLSWQPPQKILNLSAQLAEGLSSDRLANPRQIKRFLNAFGVRAMVAASRQVTITPSVLMKMLLLEDLHRTSFETLAATPKSERSALLADWEAWGHGDEAAIRPNKINEDTHHWAASEPSLANPDVSLDLYLDLAASLLNVRAGDDTSDAVIRLIGDLLGPSTAAREAALTELTALGETEQRTAMEFALRQGRRLDDLDVLFEMAIKWADKSPSLVDLVINAGGELLRQLTTGTVVNMNGADLKAQYQPTIHRLAHEDGVNSMVAEAARMEIESLNGH
ncbi:P-loop ATPase [Mycolicibacterium sp. P9-64]|uniref:KAP family P-loop NTPase fold protein n=1 Tax=Mycolicibacterium sp. P9-64 TaxID=2024612 RepID=UPI0011EE4BED|nr:P-loop NTPase fold protein [Mycolicibacterium sp. P9-64]KAA0085576.1 P-loop ATPase [Mycolicibacterium sp. P9-64]